MVDVFDDLRFVFGFYDAKTPLKATILPIVRANSVKASQDITV